MAKENNSKSGLATAGMVLGIIAICGAWIPLLNVVSLILAILAVIFAGVGLYQTLKKGRSNKGMAIAGVVLGVISIILFATVNKAAVDVIDNSIKEATTSEVKDAKAVAEKIALGSTKEEVNAVVGVEPSCSTSSTDMGSLGVVNTEICSYGNVLTENGYISVVFNDGKVSSKSAN